MGLNCSSQFEPMVEVELQCICGWPIRGPQDLRIAGGGENETIFRCVNSICNLEELCRVSREGGRYLVGFSPMFSDWNLIRMGRDRLEKELEKMGAMIVESIAGKVGKKIFKVVTRWRAGVGHAI